MTTDTADAILRDLVAAMPAPSTRKLTGPRERALRYLSQHPISGASPVTEDLGMTQRHTIREWRETLGGTRWIGLFPPGETNNHSIHRIASAYLVERGEWAGQWVCSIPDRPKALRYGSAAEARAALRQFSFRRIGEPEMGALLHD